MLKKSLHKLYEFMKAF